MNDGMLTPPTSRPSLPIEAVLAAVAGESRDGVVAVDSRSVLFFANAAAQRLLAWTPASLPHGPLHDVLHPSHGVAAHILGGCRLQRALRKGWALRGEMDVFLRGDGEPLSVSYDVAPILVERRAAGAIVTIRECGAAPVEEQMREWETQYRSIFEATTNGLVIIDRTGAIVEANPAYCAIFGYEHDELIGLPYDSLFHPEARGVAAEAFTAVVAGGTPRVRTTMLRKDGAVVHVEGQGVSFLYMGTPHLLGIVRDITEQVRADARLREQEAQYHAIFEATMDALIIGDFEGNVVEANPAACRMYGYSHDEIVGLRAVALTYPDSLPTIEQFIGEVASGGIASTQAVNLRKDGGAFPVEAHATAFAYMGAPHLLIIARDITDRVRAEAQLREQEAQYRGIFEATSDGVAIVSLDGVIVEANPALCRLLDYSYEEVIGRQVSTVVHPEDVGLHAEGVRVTQSGSVNYGRARIVRRDGSTFVGGGQALPFLYRGAPHMLSVMRDITADVRAFELLEERVAERTQELTTLLDVAHNVASTLELGPLLGLILDQLKAVADYTSATILILEGGQLRRLDYRGPQPRDQMLGLRVPLAQASAFREMLRREGPILLDDLEGDEPLARAYRAETTPQMRDAFGRPRSLLGVPMRIKERTIGGIWLDYHQPGAFTERHARLVLAIGAQAAVAIENARLYAEAQELATHQERARLARDLHDSVTQMLFSASLIAEVLPHLWERDQESGRRRLEDVRVLTRGALAEMRTLLLELRPAALAEAMLGDLLRPLADALAGRKRIQVGLVVTDERRLPPDVQVALYRIAQEALNNVAKHAQATGVEIRLVFDPDGVLLSVSDDGRGFDPTAVGAGHFGLGIMEERAATIGASLAVESRTAEGTRVWVAWRASAREPDRA